MNKFTQLFKLMSLVGGNMDLHAEHPRNDVRDILRWNMSNKAPESTRISKAILKTLASSSVPPLLMTLHERSILGHIFKLAVYLKPFMGALIVQKPKCSMGLRSLTVRKFFQFTCISHFPQTQHSKGRGCTINGSLPFMEG